MPNDLLLLLASGAAIFALTIFLEKMARRGVWPYWLCRKLLHVGAIGACAVLPLYLNDLRLLTGLVAAAEVALLYLVYTGRLFRAEDGRRSWGIALFPLAYLVLLVGFRNVPGIIALAMGILAISDAAAAVVGHYFPKQPYNLTGDPKTLAGSAAFAGSAFLLLWLAGGWYGPAPGVGYTGFSLDPAHVMAATGRLSVEVIGWSLLLAVLLAAVEALGSRGWDNVLIPLAAAFLLVDPAQMRMPDGLWMMALTLAAAVPFCTYTIRKQSLTPGGAVTAALFGLWVVYFAGFVWLLPLFVFFGTSTGIGRLLKGRGTAVAAAKHGQPRDYRQVACNGGIYAALATFAGSYPETVLPAMLVSMAISTSDTWSSEIGIAMRGRTYDVVRWRSMPVGLSGGVSWQGTLAGLAGAFLLAWIGHLLLDRVTNPGLIGKVTLAGFAGMLLDSVLGALFQAKYTVLPTSRLASKDEGESQPPGWQKQGKSQAALVEEATPGTQLAAGWRWMDNDLVNVLSNVVITGAYLFIQMSNVKQGM